MERLLAADTALVTGAASNIGRAIAECFCREGARVLMADVDEARGQAAAAAIRAAGGSCDFVQADLSQPDAGETLARRAIEHLGRVSLFVHSAAPARREQDTVFDVTAETFDRMLTVNARTGFFLGRDIGRHMRDAGIGGRMVYITSLHTRTPRNLPHYSAAKAALGMVVQELARALAPSGIRVNAVAPGAVMGGGYQPPAAQRAALDTMIPMGRTGRAEEVAQAVLALVLDRFSSYITGATVDVDGGLGLYNWIPAPARPN